MDKNVYSPVELMIISHFDWLPLVDHVSPPVLYDHMARECFINEDESRFARAVREAIKAMRRGVYRRTAEFDSMLESILHEIQDGCLVTLKSDPIRGKGEVTQVNDNGTVRVKWMRSGYGESNVFRHALERVR